MPAADCSGFCIDQSAPHILHPVSDHHLYGTDSLPFSWPSRSHAWLKPLCVLPAAACCRQGSLPLQWPAWNQVDAKNPNKTFDALLQQQRVC
jgi:hypothetical protein